MLDFVAYGCIAYWDHASLPLLRIRCHGTRCGSLAYGFCVDFLGGDTLVPGLDRRHFYAKSKGEPMN